MRVYLHLLHLPIMDLRQAVEDALEENPMLEEVSRSGEPEDTETPAPSIPKNTDNEAGETLPDDWAARDPLTFTNAPSDLSRRKHEDTRKIKDFQETLIAKPESLFDYLEWQVRFLELDKAQKRIAAEIIGNIDPEGYLKATLDEIAVAAKSDPGTVEKVLTLVQRFDPPRRWGARSSGSTFNTTRTQRSRSDACPRDRS